MGWGNYLVKSSDLNLLGDYLADFIDDPIATVHQPAAVERYHLAVIGVDCQTVDLVCDGCGRQQRPGCGSSVVVDLDVKTTLCISCREEQRNG